MFPKLSIKVRISNKQKGSALVLAIFIIVVMTLLGSALVRMMTSTAETIAYEVIGTRAYLAAQSGAQIKLGEIFPLNSSGVACPADSTYNFSAIKGLDNCDIVNVTCNAVPIGVVTYYTITSTSQCSVAGIFTSREIEIKARSL